jgi:hypothetical protein
MTNIYDIFKNGFIKNKLNKYLFNDNKIYVYGKRVVIQTPSIELQKGQYKIEIETSINNYEIYKISNGQIIKLNENKINVLEDEKINIEMRCINNRNMMYIQNFKIISIRSTKIVISKGSGGLGDNMNVMIRAKYYAKMIGAEYYADWRNTLYDNNKVRYSTDLYNSDTNVYNRYFEDRYDLDEMYDKICKIEDVNYYPLIWNTENLYMTEMIILDKYSKIDSNEEFIKNIRKQLHDKIYTIKDIKQYNKDVVVFNGPNLNDLSTEMEEKMYREIKFNNDLIMRGEKFIEDFITTKNYIGVHYRHGNGEFNKITMYDKYFMEIDKIKKEDNINIFLSTDSLEVENIFMAKYENVYVYPKFMPTINSGPIHKHIENKDRATEGENAVIDMYILSRGKYLIYNYSSFNWYAKYNGQFNKMIEIK